MIIDRLKTCIFNDYDFIKSYYVHFLPRLLFIVIIIFPHFSDLGINNLTFLSGVGYNSLYSENDVN